MKTQSLQLLSYTDYDGSSIELTGTEQKAAGYSSSTGTLQSVGIFTEDFIGTIYIEATLDSTPTASSWFTVYTFQGDGSSANDSTARFWNEVQNITGKYTWIRARVDNQTQGTIHKVTLSY